MIEIKDISGVKFRALIVCYIKYGDKNYAIYSVKRDNTGDNIFISELVNSSDGYTMSNNYTKEEKILLDKVVNNIINMVGINKLNSDGVEFIDDLELAKVNCFNVKKCYVTTIARNILKDVMVNYNLMDVTAKKVVLKEKKVSCLNKDNLSTVFSVLLGMLVIVIAIIVIFIINK